jgi:hypothetical protein
MMMGDGVLVVIGFLGFALRQNKMIPKGIEGEE